MSEQKTFFIRQKVKVPGYRILLAWLLLACLPVMASLYGLGYFLDEYSYIAESECLTEAFNTLEAYQNAQVVENFLTARLTELTELKPDATDAANPERLDEAISKILGGKSIICLYFNHNRQKTIMRNHRPDDLKDTVFPPAALLKKQLPFLDSGNRVDSAEKSALLAAGDIRRRNALSIQQLFKTMTPVTFSSEKVAKNFSVHFGGDLYFVYVEFASGTSEIAGFLSVFRGRDFSTDYLHSRLKRDFPRCRTVRREMNIARYETVAAIEQSGIKRYHDRIVLTAPADQRFIRHMLHGGGHQLQNNADRHVFFNQYHLPLSAMHHQFAAFKPWLKTAAALILAVSGLFCLRFILFGVNMTTSFKRRILAMTLASAMFPFAFFATSFYLHQQYDAFLRKINLLQHINTRLATINSELEHYLAWIESSLSLYFQQINSKNLNDDAEIMKVFEAIGRALPVTRLALQRPENALIKEFEERSSVDEANDSSSVVQKFFPKKSLDLLREQAPLNRTRQDQLALPGAILKIALIGTSMVSQGSFFNVEHAGLPAWLSNTRVVDETAPGKPVLGLLFSRVEPAPLIKTYLQQCSMAADNFEEENAGYLIRYAFFPVKRTGLNQVWSGSGHTSLPQIAQAAEKIRSESSATRNQAGEEELLINRLNHGMPHNAVAFATPMRVSLAFSNTLIGIAGSLLYIFLIWFLVNCLLDRFFVQPVMEMAICAEQIARGSDSWPLVLKTGDELDTLNRSFAGLVTGLQQRNMLKDYVSDDAYTDLTANRTSSLSPGGEYCEATILFAAIKDYQTLTADSTPANTVKLLNGFISLGDRIVREFGGSLDKILSNTLMLVFRETAGETTSHALRAAQTALKLAEDAKRDLNIGIYAGISSGTVISGKIGSYQGKLDFTVIGNPVNLAARLKAEASDSSTGIIISGTTMRLLKGKGRVNFLRRCSLKGKAREYNIYELCDLR